MEKLQVQIIDLKEEAKQNAIEGVTENLAESFKPFFKEAQEIMEASALVKVENLGQTAEMGLARKYRLKLKEVRVNAEKKRKELKKQALQKGHIGIAPLDDKTAVFGLVQRGGEVRAIVVPDILADRLTGLVRENVEVGSVIFTDEFNGYRNLESSGYVHGTVKHNHKQYVNGPVHTNTIEGFWSLLKRGIYGIYHNVSPKHLQRYCDEFGYRYNTRAITSPVRFGNVIAGSGGRLTYKGLILAAGDPKCTIDGAKL